MVSDFRAIVLGLGGIGSASAYWLSRRLGEEVLGIEQFELGHGRGASEDHSRIIRLSYHTPGYVEMARSAYEAWETLEVESGEQVILRTGGLDLASPSSVIGLDAYRESMSTAGVPFEEVDAAEVMKRWPQWRLPGDVVALFRSRRASPWPLGPTALIDTWRPKTEPPSSTRRPLLQSARSTVR